MTRAKTLKATGRTGRVACRAPAMLAQGPCPVGRRARGRSHSGPML